MFHTLEYFDVINIDGLEIFSRRGLKGNEEHGILEVIEIIGYKNGVYRGKDSKWATGTIYDTDKYTYEEAMAHWQSINLLKFAKVA